MFNFTTQTVYNQISTTGANKNLIDNSGASKVPSLRSWHLPPAKNPLPHSRCKDNTGDGQDRA